MLTEEVINGNHSYDIPQQTIDEEIADLLSKVEAVPGFDPHVEFDPEKHIVFKDEDFEKTRRFTLEELNITKTHVKPCSDIAVTDSFPLFSEEAINIMKWEAFQEETVKKYGRLPYLAKGHTRTDMHIGTFAKYQGPFSYAAWSHPRTLEIMSMFAGIQLKTMLNSELAHVNASLSSRTKDERANADRSELLKRQTAEDANSSNDLNAVVGWHYDSDPFVCVMMLSAPKGMIGGETGIRGGDESIIRIKDPKPGYATVLQGRVVRHIATKPISNDERISSVTAFIPADPEMYDSSWLKSIKPGALPRALNDVFYPEWFEYRFKRIEERLKLHRERLVAGVKKGEKFDQMKSIKFCQDIEEYLQGSWKEMEAVCDEEYPPPLFVTPYSDLPDYK